MGTELVSPLLAHTTELRRLLPWVDQQDGALRSIARRYIECIRGGGKLVFAGNGGSAADCQHIAAEYVVRYTRDRAAIPALALTVDTSVLTAAGNDLGFNRVFERQVEALGRPGDLLILHSTSGNSQNLVGAVVAAWKMGMPVIALLGRDGGLLQRMLLTETVVVPCQTTSVIQEIHLLMQHVLVEMVEQGLGL